MRIRRGLCLFLLLGCGTGGPGGSVLSDASAEGGASADAASTAHLCEPREVKVWGTLDGVPLDVTYPGKGFTIYAYGGADVHASFATEGSFVAARTSAYDREQPVSFALIQFPHEGPFAEEVYCAGPSSTIAHERRPITFKLRSLVRRSSKSATVPDAGTCEGAAIQGELEGCVGPGN
ncbi:MAG: hypothetical protein U0235_03340 [Polyangiaceae bacterium]